MSMKLFPKPAQIESTGDDRDVAQLIRRGTVCYEGKLAWLTHEEFVEVDKPKVFPARKFCRIS